MTERSRPVHPRLPVLPRERGGIVVTILVALLVAALIVLLAVGLAGYFAVRKASEVVEEVKRDPGAKVVKWIERVNPDLEITRQPDGRYHVRNKRTGEEATVNLSQLREGSFEMTGPDGKRVRVAAEEGGITVDRDGTVARLGAVGPAPDWLPVYPGGEGYGTGLGATGVPGLPEDLAGTRAWSVTVPDPPDEVLAWYGERLAAQGFEVGAPEGFGLEAAGGKAAGRSLTARHRHDGRELRVLAFGGKAGGTAGTEVVVTLRE